MSLRLAPEDLREKYRAIAERDIQREIDPGDPRFTCNLLFARNRIDEGIELANHFAGKYPARSLVILDVGAGNGEVAFGLANESKTLWWRLMSPHGSVAYIRRETSIPVRQVVARADQLPFRTGRVDVVLCLETIEHLPKFRDAGREMMRVLRAGGQVMLTTPARIRFLLRPDPHFAVRGLLMLPDRLQKIVVERWLRRRGEYDVQHTFWTAWSIIHAFPGRGRTETLVSIPWPGRPRNIRELLWKLSRHVLWDRIVIYKRPG